MASKIQKGDMVQVIAGDHKGATGRVMSVIPEDHRVLIEGVNLVHKHVRPSQRNPQGGRIRVEQPIHISNVLPLNSKTGKGTRVHFETDKDGNKKRVASDGTPIDTIRKSTRK